MQAKLSPGLIEARYYLPAADGDQLADFADRQFRARRRFAVLEEFYQKNPCRMARLHLLAASAIALGRFAGYSESFDRIGQSLMPVDEQSVPRTTEWLEFVEACTKKLPVEVREEAWLAAHFRDFELAREQGLDTKFYADADLRKDDSTWQLLRRHMEVSLGRRLMDDSAISGVLPYETAMADSLAHFVKKLFTAGFALLGRYAAETLRAIFSFSSTSPGLVSYRRTAFSLIYYMFLSFTVSNTFRRGLRERERGHVADTEGWNLLEAVLGERTAEINPLIVRFYSNPSHFDVVSTLKLETLPARFWTWIITLFIGQGLYESGPEEIPTRFRIFRRADGSMHFIRELYCRGKYRVFDSDFVVRKNTLYEVFTDLKMAVEMDVTPLEGGSVIIQSRKVLWRGRRMPSLGFHVEFISRVDRDLTGEYLQIMGELQMKPASKIGEFFARKILRRPRNLGSIHYVARPK